VSLRQHSLRRFQAGMATACGDGFIVCVTEGGEVWAWSDGEKGSIEDDKLLPQRVGRLEDFDAPVVMMRLAVTTQRVRQTAGCGAGAMEILAS